MGGSDLNEKVGQFYLTINSRVLFIVDGNIKGEYTGLKEITDEKERERYLLIY